MSEGVPKNTPTPVTTPVLASPRGGKYAQKGTITAEIDNGTCLDCPLGGFESQGDTKVREVAKQAQEWLGDYETITNDYGDHIFLSKDGLRKMRFDVLNPRGDVPHIHLEILRNGKWKDAIGGTHRIYLKQ